MKAEQMITPDYVFSQIRNIETCGFIMGHLVILHQWARSKSPRVTDHSQPFRVICVHTERKCPHRKLTGHTETDWYFRYVHYNARRRDLDSDRSRRCDFLRLGKQKTGHPFMRRS